MLKVAYPPLMHTNYSKNTIIKNTYMKDITRDFDVYVLAWK